MSSAHPLLGHEAEDELWDAIDDAQENFTYVSPNSFYDSLSDLELENPNEEIRFLETDGVVKVADIRVPGEIILSGLLEDDSIVSQPCGTPTLDYEQFWISMLRERQRMSSRRKSKTLARSYKNKTVPCVAYVCRLRLTDIGSPEGLIHNLVQRYYHGTVSESVFALPAVQALVDHKWSAYGRRLMQWQFVCYLVWVGSFYVFTVAFQDEDISLTLSRLVCTRAGLVAVASDVVSLLAMTPSLVIDVATARLYGLKAWASAWNVLDVLTYGLQLYISVCHVLRWRIESGELSVVAALLAVLLLFKIQYFSRVAPRKDIRFSFVDDVRRVLHDVRYFMMFLVLILAGYATAFQILFRADQER
jgi:hypothetical protein